MVEPLVLPFVVVVRDERADGATPRALADQDQAREAGVLDGAHEARRVGVQVRRAGGALDGGDIGWGERVAHGRPEARVAGMDEDPDVSQASVLGIGGVPHELGAPRPVGLGADARDLTAAAGQVTQDQHGDAGQAAWRPDRDREAVGGGEHVPVAFRQRYPQVTEILVEEAANGAAIVNALRHQIPGLIAVRPEGGKVARAQAVAPLVEAGNVYLPNPRPDGRLCPQRAWVEDFLDQCTAFPKVAHDDDIDALTQLLVRWQQPQLLIRVRRLDEGLPPRIPLYG